MQSKFVKCLFSLVLLSAIILNLFGCNVSETATQKEIYALDTIITITAYGVDDVTLRDAEAEIRRLESIFSVTDDNSDISKINSSPDRWVRVEEETFYLISLSKEISESSNGNFDITILPAVKLWGFTTDSYNVPEKSEIDNIQAFIDYTKIELDSENSCVKIPEGFSLDLGAIAKGYIADKVSDVLTKGGVSSALMNFGGNIKLIGSKPDKSLWKIGVKTPFEDGYFATLSLENVTASTAGGYERYFEENGRIYHHILNPHTASPAETDVLSATVVGEKGEICDALATSCFVAGIEGIKGLISEYPDYSIVLYTSSRVYVSESLKDLFALDDEHKNTEIIYI